MISTIPDLMDVPAELGEVDWTDLFCGGGGSSLGLYRVPGFKVRYALNHWDLAVQAHNANFPDTDHEVTDIQDVHPSRFGRTRCAWFSPSCFEAGTLVLTARGLVPIEDVEVGHYVLTHKNRWRRVTRIQNKPGQIGTLKGQGHPGLRVTGNHGIWGRKSKRGWQNERQNSYRAWESAEWIDASCMRLSESYWSSPANMPSPWDSGDDNELVGPDLPIHFNDDPMRWLWITGRWLGDGWVAQDDKHKREVSICCGHHEVDQLTEDLGPGWVLSRRRTSCVFIRSDEELRNFLFTNFGSGAAEKHIPTWVITNLNEEGRRALLNGYLSADGHIGPRRTELTTVSKKLAISTRLLVQSLGHSPSVFCVPQHSRSIEGREINGLDLWRVTWENNGNAQEAFFDDDLFWAPTREWSNDLDETTVYNIEIEEDHSYVADGIVVKNCTHHAYCRGIHSDDEEAMRSRATMWDVCRWAEYHRYDVCVVENVVEIKLWCDKHYVLEDGHKVFKCNCGASYDAWINEMFKLGYVAQEVYFNSQHALVPQSRDRLYIVFSRADMGTAPDVNFAPPCWCEEHGVVTGIQTWKKPTKRSARDNPRLHHWGRYGKQYLYTCPSCAVVVAPAVLGSWSVIDHSLPIATIGSRTKPIADATRKRIKVGLERIGRLEPIQVQVGGNLFERPGYARVWSLEDPLRTVTTTSYMGMVTPAGGQSAHAKPMHEPSHTVMTSDRLAAVIPNKTNNVGRSTAEPMGVVTTAPASHMLVRAGGQSPAGRDSDEPMMTITAHDRQIGMLVPLRKGMNGQPDVEPSPALATRSDQGFLVYNGVPGFVRVLDDAAGTITSRDKQSLLVPYNRTALAHGDHEPMTTVTTRDRSALLEVTDDDIDDMLFRMLKWPELQRAQAMHAMPDGSPYQLTARVKTKKGYKDLSDEQRVKMVGNAVSSPVAAMIGHAVAQCLAAAA